MILTIFCSQPTVATDLVTGQVVLEDTVILHPVQPASGLSACPGQDVTINCTIVRMTNIADALPPTLTWLYRGDIIENNNPSPSVYYTVVSHVVGLTVMSNATIDSVQISDHNRAITCRSKISTMKLESETITIAGNEVSIKNYKYMLYHAYPWCITNTVTKQ